LRWGSDGPSGHLQRAPDTQNPATATKRGNLWK